MQSALTAIAAAGGGPIYVPSGHLQLERRAANRRLGLAPIPAESCFLFALPVGNVVVCILDAAPDARYGFQVAHKWPRRSTGEVFCDLHAERRVELPRRCVLCEHREIDSLETVAANQQLRYVNVSAVDPARVHAETQQLLVPRFCTAPDVSAVRAVTREHGRKHLVRRAAAMAVSASKQQLGPAGSLASVAAPGGYCRPMLRVSVLLPVYNAEPYLQAALDSLTPDLASDVEVIVVNDGSTDGSAEILDRWSAPRVTVIHQDNAGLTGALRAAAFRATTGVIARMDADDLNMPGRIPAAVRLLKDRRDVVLVSPWAQQIDMAGEPLGMWQFPWDAAAVDRALYLTNPICHGAAIFRRSAYEAAGGYLPSACEDLHLWDRMSDHGKIALIPKALYRYRVGDDSYTSRHAIAQAEAAEDIKRARWDRRPPSTKGTLRAAVRYRGSQSRAVHRAHLRELAAGSRIRRDPVRFAKFAAAWAVA